VSNPIQMEKHSMFAKLTAPACPVIAGCLLIVWAVTDHARAQSAWPKSPATENAKPIMPAKPRAGKRPAAVADQERRGAIANEASYCEVEPPCPRGCVHDTVNKICLDAPR
jgi:hypothetical protein